MAAGQVIWEDGRLGKNGWEKVLLLFSVIGLPLVIAFLVYTVLFGDFTNALDARLVLTITLVCICVLFLGGVKMVWLLRNAPHRILQTEDMLCIQYFFGKDKDLPVSEILSAALIKQSVFKGLFSPYGFRLPVLEIRFIDGTTLLLNGDCTEDSIILSLVRKFLN